MCMLLTVHYLVVGTGKSDKTINLKLCNFKNI